MDGPQLEHPDSEYLEQKSNRVAECKEILEGLHIDLVDKAIANGWTEREVASAMFLRALAHLRLISDGAPGLSTSDGSFHCIQTRAAESSVELQWLLQSLQW